MCAYVQFHVNYVVMYILCTYNFALVLEGLLQKLSTSVRISASKQSMVCYKWFIYVCTLTMLLVIVTYVCTYYIPMMIVH